MPWTSKNNLKTEVDYHTVKQRIFYEKRIFENWATIMHNKSVLIWNYLWNVTLFPIERTKKISKRLFPFFQVIYVHISLRSSPLKRRVFVNYDPGQKEWVFMVLQSWPHCDFLFSYRWLCYCLIHFHELWDIWSYFCFIGNFSIIFSLLLIEVINKYLSVLI